jgi:hypothetical protein
MAMSPRDQSLILQHRYVDAYVSHHRFLMFSAQAYFCAKQLTGLEAGACRLPLPLVLQLRCRPVRRRKHPLAKRAQILSVVG